MKRWPLSLCARLVVARRDFMIGVSVALAVALVAAGRAPAQERDRSPLDPTHWGVVYDHPAAAAVRVTAGVPYLADDRGTLTIDIYAPSDAPPASGRPAVVFLNAIGDPPDDKVKSWGIYESWPRLVAAHGMAGISMDADATRIPDCLRGVFAFLAEHGAEHGIDASRLGVYAASANVSRATGFLMGSDAAPGIRAAALYYGSPPDGALRADLPVLFIVAESDAAGQHDALNTLWTRVLEQQAPWTLVFASDLPHAFDAFSDNDEARRLIQQTLAFWKSHLEPVPQPSWTPSPARAIVAAQYAHEPERVLELLEPWLKEHPDDVDAHIQRGASLKDLQRHAEAASAYERALALDAENRRATLGLAQARLNMQQWAEAASLSERLIASGLEASHVRGMLAYAQLGLGRNEDAVRNYEKALELGIPAGSYRSLTWYNLACGYARVGKTEKGLSALQSAVDEGFSDGETLRTDPDLAPLRSDPRFQEIAGRLGAGAGS
jgi:Tfp pilus assembly protein PilF